LPLQQRALTRMTFGFDNLTLSALRFYIGIRHRMAARDPAAFLNKLSSQLCYADRKVLQDAEVCEMLVQGMQEAGRQGGAGLAMDTSLCLKPCDFMPEEISVPVQLWHGSADSLISTHQVGLLAERLTDCSIRRAGNSGHFFFRQYAEEIFAAADERLKPVSKRSSFEFRFAADTPAFRKPYSRPVRQLVG
jgi:pimeloyl-ACP methyl ester carboxylesterase